MGSAKGGDGDLLAVLHHALHQFLGRAVGRRALVIRPRVRTPLHDLLTIFSPPVLIIVGPVHHLVLTPIFVIIPCSGSSSGRWRWRLGLWCLRWLWGLCVHWGSSLMRLFHVVMLLLLLGWWKLRCLLLLLVMLWLVQRRRRDLGRVVMLLMKVLLRG